MSDSTPNTQSTAATAAEALRVAAQVSQSLRGRFTADNARDTWRTVAVVVVSVLCSELGHLDADQWSVVIRQVGESLGLPALVPVAVGLYGWWRSDR